VEQAETASVVRLGAHVEVELIDVEGGSEHLAFDIVPEQAANFAQGLLGVNTPLAQAILGEPVGSEIAYDMGDVQRVRILSVRQADTDIAGAEQERQAVLQKALERAERTNAEMFASSFSGKWGDYDPAGVEKWTEPPDDESAPGKP
jgi:hypothetical protein